MLDCAAVYSESVLVNVSIVDKGSEVIADGSAVVVIDTYALDVD